MKVIPLDDLLKNVNRDVILLEALYLSASGLCEPARGAVAGVVAEQIGMGYLFKRRWEERAEEPERPDGASA